MSGRNLNEADCLAIASLEGKHFETHNDEYSYPPGNFILTKSSQTKAFTEGAIATYMNTTIYFIITGTLKAGESAHVYHPSLKTT